MLLLHMVSYLYNCRRYPCITHSNKINNYIFYHWKQRVQPSLSYHWKYYLYYFPRAVIKYCKLGAVKPQIFVSHFWSLEIRNQGVGRAMLSAKPRGEDSPCLTQLQWPQGFLDFWQHNCNLCLHATWCFLGLSLSEFPSSYRTSVISD